MTNGSVRADGAVLICDCDGVLIDSEAVAASMLVKELEVRWPGTDVEAVVVPLLGQRIERLLSLAADSLGKTLADHEVDAIRAAVEAAAQTAPLVDGVEAALERIALRKACASNSYTPYVERVLARTGLVRVFGSAGFCADRVERPKPAPDVYLAAARSLGVGGGDCIVVEDSAAGVAAATAAGMVVLGFIGGTHATDAHVEALRQAGAAVVFEEMRELPALVTRWLAGDVGQRVRA